MEEERSSRQRSYITNASTTSNEPSLSTVTHDLKRGKWRKNGHEDKEAILSTHRQLRMNHRCQKFIPNLRRNIEKERS